MRHLYWLPAVAALLLSGNVLANEPDMGKSHKFEPAKTRQEAIARTKERLAKLESMSDEDWGKKRAEMQKRHQERRAMRKARLKEHRKEALPAAGKSAAVPVTPATPAEPAKQ